MIMLNEVKFKSVKLKSLISTFVLLALLAVIIAALGKILTPFIIALIFAYIFNPFVDKIETQLKIKRPISGFIIAFSVFVLFLLIPLFVIPECIMKLNAILKQIPNLVNLINIKVLANLNSKYNTHLVIDVDAIKEMLINNVNNPYAHIKLFSPIAHNGFVVVEVLLYVILIPFVLFYSIAKWHKIIVFGNELIPNKYKGILHALINDIDRVLSAYLHGQISVMLIMALYYALALHFIGLNSGILIGAITGLLVFIPYLGILSGFIVALLVSVTSIASTHQALLIIGVFVGGHVLEGGLVTPFLVGSSIGLNPIMIIFALMVFSKLLGFVGILLALPLAAIATVVLRYLRAYYLRSGYYNEDSHTYEKEL